MVWTYLDLDQFFYPVHNPDVFIPVRRLADLDLIASPHEATFGHVHECLFRGFLVLEIPQNNAGRLDQELSWLVVSSDLIAFSAHDLGFVARYQTTRGTKPDVVGSRGAHNRTCLGETVALADLPVGISDGKLFSRFLAQGCSAGEDLFHTRQVEFLQDLRVLDHGDDDRWHDVECVDLVLLDRGQIVLQVELWQNDDTVSTICRGVADDDQAVDV